MFRPSRSRSGTDRLVYLKTALFFLAAGFFAVGVAFRRDWPVLLAVAVALAAWVLRFAPRREEPPPGEE